MLKPSDAHLWVNCALAGNVMTTGHYYGTPLTDTGTGDSDSRREGTCAHWVAEAVFSGRASTPHELIGEQHSNGWIVDTDMAARVAAYIDYVRGFGEPVAAEMPVELFGIIRGRLDTVTASTSDVVRIFDYKDGWRIAEAEKNYAMLCYGLAVAHEVTTRTGETPCIELHIFQPRPTHPEGHARMWRIDPAMVPNWWEWLHERAVDCLPESNPRGHPGAHCRDCPAAASCQALAARVNAVYDCASDHRMVNHTPEQMAAELHFLDMAEDVVKARRAAIRAEVTARIRQGQHIPGVALVPKHGNRRFTVAPEVIRRATGHDPYKPVLITPAELERKGVPPHIVNQLAEKPFTGLELTLNPEKLAQRMFGKNEQS